MMQLFCFIFFPFSSRVPLDSIVSESLKAFGSFQVMVSIETSVVDDWCCGRCSVEEVEFAADCNGGPPNQRVHGAAAAVAAENAAS